MKKIAWIAALVLIAVGCATPGDWAGDMKKANEIRERAGKILVKVTFKLRKNQAIDAESSLYDPPMISMISRGGRFIMTGFVLSKNGEVVVEDPRVQEKDLEKIEVTTFSGKTFTVKPVAITRRASGLILAAETPPDGLEDLDLSVDRMLAFGDRVRVATLRFEEEKMTISSGGGAVASVENDGTLGIGLGTKLIMDEEGVPIGVSLLNFQGQGNEGGVPRNPFWKIREFHPENRIGLADAAKTADRVNAVTAPWRVNVRFFLKRDEETEERGEAEMMRYARSSGYGGSGEQNLEDRRFLGVVLGKGLVFVPSKLPIPMINMLGDIEAVAGDGKVFKGRFVGAYREMGGMILDFGPELTAAAPPVMSSRRAQKGDLFYTLSQEKRRGQEYVEAVYNRVSALALDQLELEKDAFIPMPEHRVKEGSILVDEKGEWLGFYTTKEKDGQEESRYGGYYRPRYSSSGESDVRMLFVADLQKELIEPVPFFDPRAIVHSREQKGKLIWLGVEWQAIDRAVAEQLDILKPTADGRRGLLVTGVYPGSPAEKIGLAKGDTLLYLVEEGKGENEKKEFMAGGGYYDDFDRYGYMRRGRGAFASWKDRRNYLTEMLTKIGKGKKIALHYVNGKDVKSAEIVLEEAPPDQSNARYYKCEPLGLTVKDLTYEVKSFMQYPPEKQGVVVSRVEPGSGAAVAKILPMMIVLKVNGVEVRDHAHFREIVEKLRDQKPEYVTLYCETAGDSMFAEAQTKWSPGEQ